MKNRSKVLKISRSLKYHAQLLERTFRSSWPWDLTRLMCDTYLEGLWEHLKEIDRLLPADSHLKNKIAKSEGNLQQLADKIYMKASWLHNNFDSPKYSDWSVTLVVGRTIYKGFLARLTEFQELYNRTVEERKHEVVKDSSFTKLIDLSDEMKENVKRVKAKYNIAE